MATLKDYFKTDLRPPFRLEARWSGLLDGVHHFKFESAALLDPAANVRYLAFYFSPDTHDTFVFEKVIDDAEWYLDKTNDLIAGPSVDGAQLRVENHGDNRVSLVFTWPGDLRQVLGASLNFTGRIYFYIESPISPEERDLLEKHASRKGLTLVFRGTEYAAERDRHEKPRAFISHDFRDEKIARAIATKLRAMRCPVWYAEFSLTVGDSLRESIEAGLKACHMCIFVLTSNFLAKGGWPKREYGAIFTREIVEDKKLILPVWVGVTKQDVYEYSPILSDRYALLWEQGEDQVCTQLFKKLFPK